MYWEECYLYNRTLCPGHRSWPRQLTKETLVEKVEKQCSLDSGTPGPWGQGWEPSRNGVWVETHTAQQWVSQPLAQAAPRILVEKLIFCRKKTGGFASEGPDEPGEGDRNEHAGDWPWRGWVCTPSPQGEGHASESPRVSAPCLYKWTDAQGSPSTWGELEGDGKAERQETSRKEFGINRQRGCRLQQVKLFPKMFSMTQEEILPVK